MEWHIFFDSHGNNWGDQGKFIVKQEVDCRDEDMDTRRGEKDLLEKRMEEIVYERNKYTQTLSQDQGV